jgi:hypothetical protein
MTPPITIKDPTTARIVITRRPQPDGTEPASAEGFGDGKLIVRAAGRTAGEAFENLLQMCPALYGAPLEWETQPAPVDPEPEKPCHGCGKLGPVAVYRITFLNNGDQLIRELCPTCEATFLTSVINAASTKETPDADF